MDALYKITSQNETFICVIAALKAQVQVLEAYLEEPTAGRDMHKAGREMYTETYDLLNLEEKGAQELLEEDYADLLGDVRASRAALEEAASEIKDALLKKVGTQQHDVAEETDAAALVRSMIDELTRVESFQDSRDQHRANREAHLYHLIESSESQFWDTFDSLFQQEFAEAANKKVEQKAEKLKEKQKKEEVNEEKVKEDLLMKFVKNGRMFAAYMGFPPGAATKQWVSSMAAVLYATMLATLDDDLATVSLKRVTRRLNAVDESCFNMTVWTAKLEVSLAALRDRDRVASDNEMS